MENTRNKFFFFFCFIFDLWLDAELYAIKTYAISTQLAQTFKHSMTNERILYSMHSTIVKDVNVAALVV